MSSNSMSPNQREILSARSTVTGKQEYITSTNNILNVNATFSASAIAIQDGSNSSIKATVLNLTNSHPLTVAITDSSGNQISSFGGGTQYADGTTQATPTGTVALGKNSSNVLHSLALDSSGNLNVNVAAGGGSGGTSSSFGAAFPSTGTAIGATDGTNMQSLKVDGSKNLLTSINVALPAGTNVIGHVITDTGSTTAVTGTVTVSGTVTANAGTNLNTSLLALESGGNLASVATNTTNIPNVIGTAASAIPSKLLQIGGSDGTNARAIKTNTTGQLDIRPLTSGDQVTVANSTIAVTQSGTWTNTVTQATAANLNATVVGTGTAGSAASGVVTVQGITSMTPVQVSQATASNLNAQVIGSTASGSSVTSNPVTLGGRAATALPTAVSDGQVVNEMLDKFGRGVMLNNAFRDIIASQTTTITSSTAETTIITAIASTFADLASIMVSNTSATAVRVDFRDTTAGSVLFSIYVPAGDMRGVNLTSPWPQTSVNTNWTAQSSASVSDLRIAAQYIKNK